jgi:hypothetical protein
MDWKLFAIKTAMLFLVLQIVEELKTVTWPDTVVQIHRCAWDFVGWSALFAFPVMLAVILGLVEYRTWVYMAPELAGFLMATLMGLKRV